MIDERNVIGTRFLPSITPEAIELYRWDGTLLSYSDNFLRQLACNEIATVVVPDFFSQKLCDRVVSCLKAEGNRPEGQTLSDSFEARFGLSRHNALVAAKGRGLAPYSKDWFKFITEMMEEGRASLSMLNEIFFQRINEIFEFAGYQVGTAYEQVGDSLFDYCPFGIRDYCPFGIRIFAPITDRPTVLLHHDRLQHDGYLLSAGLDPEQILERSQLSGVKHQFALNIAMENTGGGETVIYNLDLEEIKKAFTKEELQKYRTANGYEEGLISAYCTRAKVALEKYVLQLPVGSLAMFNTHNGHLVNPQIKSGEHPDRRRIRLHSFLGVLTDLVKDNNQLGIQEAWGKTAPKGLLFT